MIKKNIIKPTKKWVKKKIRTVYNEIESEKKPVNKDSFITYFPNDEDSKTYMVNMEKEMHEMCELGLPVPPVKLWLGYGTEVKEYLYGRFQITKMLQILKNAGFDLDIKRKILEFGCGAGRMIRWLKPYASRCEIWGTDISSEHIIWANKYLNPPFNFVTTTTIPHLPFEDRYFDLIYAGSVFSHIDDLAKAWLLELRRILDRQGYLYVTINDKHSMKLLKTSPIYKSTWLAGFISENPAFQLNGENFGMITGGRGPASQVFYDIDFFCNSVRGFFDIVSIDKEAYGFQTGVLLRKK